MTRKWSLPQITALAAASVGVLLLPGFSAARSDRAGQRPEPVARVVTIVKPLAAPNGGTYEYRLEPFHHTNFDSRREFEDWLDELGAEGWQSIVHIPAVDPRDHQRIFMRPVGGPGLVVDFEIERYEVSQPDDVEEWVPEYDRLGGEGKFPVWFYDRGGTTYVVTEAATRDGVLLTLGWEKELAGRTGAVGRKAFTAAAKSLAAGAYVPITVGLSAGRSDLYVVGLAETAPERRTTVKLRFGKAKLNTTPRKWRKLVTKQAKKGYRLAQVELDGSADTFILVFARVKVNGVLRRRECVVEPFETGALGSTLDRLNSRGAEGYEEVIVTFGGAIDLFQFVLCRDT